MLTKQEAGHATNIETAVNELANKTTHQHPRTQRHSALNA